MEDYEFTSGDAGSAGIEKVQAGCLKKGDLVLIKEHPCRVVSMSTAKTGKHGSAKAMVCGIDIFTANKYECTFGSGDMVDAPLVKRIEYNLINIDEENYVTLLTDSGDIKEDLQLPTEEWLKDITDRIKSIFADGKKECLVSVIAALGTEKIIAVKEGADL